MCNGTTGLIPIETTWDPECEKREVVIGKKAEEMFFPTTVIHKNIYTQF